MENWENSKVRQQVTVQKKCSNGSGPLEFRKLTDFPKLTCLWDHTSDRFWHIPTDPKTQELLMSEID